MRWWRAAPQRVARAVGRRGRELARDGARVPGRGAGRAAARRHRARRRLGRRSVRAARPRRPRAAAPGQARAHAGARRRSDAASSTSPRCSAALDAARLPRPAQRRVLRPARATAGRSTTPSSGRATSPRTRLDGVNSRVAQPVRARSGGGGRGSGMPSNATRSPGIASATNSVRRSAPPKQQLVVRPLPSIGQEVERPCRRARRRGCRARSSTRRRSGRRRRGRSRRRRRGRASRSPTRGCRRRCTRCKPRALDHHDRAVGLEHDAVAVEEAVGERAHRCRRVRRPSPGRRRSSGGGIVAGVGEVHVAVGRDREVVRAVEVVVGEVRDRAVGRGELEPGRRRHATPGTRANDAGQLREVHAAVLGDEDRAVGRERGAVRAAARRPRTRSARCSLGPHAEQRARRDAGDDDACRRDTTPALRRTGCRLRPRPRTSCADSLPRWRSRLAARGDCG